MARYRVKESFNAGKETFNEGDEVDVSAIPAGCLGKFALVGFEQHSAADAGGSEEDGGADDGADDADFVVNPDRDGLKAQAEELGLTFPANISTAKLTEMVKAKLEELKAAGE